MQWSGDRCFKTRHRLESSQTETYSTHRSRSKSMTTLQHVQIQRNPCIRQFKLSVHLSTGGTCAFFSNVWRAVHGSPCFPRHLRILDSHHLRTSLLIPRPPAMFLLLPWRSCAANVLVSPILPWGTGCAVVQCKNVRFLEGSRSCISKKDHVDAISTRWIRNSPHFGGCAYIESGISVDG